MYGRRLYGDGSFYGTAYVQLYFINAGGASQVVASPVLRLLTAADGVFGNTELAAAAALRRLAGATVTGTTDTTAGAIERLVGYGEPVTGATLASLDAVLRHVREADALGSSSVLAEAVRRFATDIAAGGGTEIFGVIALLRTVGVPDPMLGNTDAIVDLFANAARQGSLFTVTDQTRTGTDRGNFSLVGLVQ